MNAQREQELAIKAEAAATRRLRVKTAHERLTGLPDQVRGRVQDRADRLEQEARRGGSREARVAFLERALDEQQLTDSGRVVIGLRDADQDALDAATATVAKELATAFAAEAVRMRQGGMTVAEIAAKLEVGAAAVRGILAGEPRGKGRRNAGVSK